MLRPNSMIRVCALLSLLLAAAALWGDSLVVVTSPAAQGANDSLAWSQLGGDATTLSAAFVATSGSGLGITVDLMGANSLTSVVCPASACSWTGTGFAAGDTLLWTSDTGNGGNGPLTLTFAHGVSGAGAFIQADGPGAFTGQIQAFNGTTLLGSFTVPSDSTGDGTYIGVADQTGANITSVTFSLTNCSSICTDFAVDTINLGTASVFPLSVSLAGTGSGTVTSSPAGINCPGVCSANFSSGQSVTLTATAASGSSFTGWSGACSGTGTCTVTMSSSQSVTATFTRSLFPLTVSLAGTGSGTVTSSPAGINCPGVCSANFSSGQSVTLTATAASGSSFTGWSGACSGTGTCTVTMSSKQSVTATFKPSHHHR